MDYVQKKILSKEKIWYKANKYFGRDFMILGLVTTVISLSLISVRNTVSIDLLILIELGVCMIPLLIIIIKSMLYVKNLEKN